MFFYSWILFIYYFLYRCSWILDYKGKEKEGNEGYIWSENALVVFLGQKFLIS
jgi:hypothetical protein